MLVNKAPNSNKQGIKLSGSSQRAILIGLIIAIICFYFWLFSRYPDLDAKAVMSKSGTVSDLLSVWPVFTLNDQDSYLVKIFKSYANWVMDNKKGMAFGVIIGGLVISLFKYVKFKTSKYAWLNSLYGILMGTPLGVCVNCAMPIFKGITQHRKIEIAFSMMVSSPTLNIVIVSLTFAMFPFYLATIKLGFTFFTIFFLIPLISKTFGEKQIKPSKEKILSHTLSIHNDSTQPVPLYESWFSSLKQILRDNYHSFKFILKTTVPLMFLAGLLGSFIVHSIDVSNLNIEGTPLTLAFIGFFSLLIPVPVSFDVMLTHALYEAGMSISFASILLCNLGIFSIYAFLIIWTSGLRKWAISLFIGMFIFSYFVGLMAPKLHDIFYIEPNISAFRQSKNIHPTEQSEKTATSPASFHKEMNSQKLTKEKLALTHPEIEIFRLKFLDKKKPFESEKFTKIEGPDIGLTEGFQYKIRDYPDTFWIGRGTGAGDFNKDGWQDIAFGTSNGIAMYKNNGAKFEKFALPAKLNDYNVYVVAFIDLNNDSWLDLFFTTFNRGNFALLNQQDGTFSEQLVTVPNNEGVITLSPAFADFDSNGYLDIFNGNIALGVVTGSWKFNKKGRQNSITYNDSLLFREVLYPGDDGETMSTLASDLNGDGKIDLYQAHDFKVPDQLNFNLSSFFNYGKQQANRGIDYSPFFSMGVDSGDLNNDGLLDLVLTGTTNLSPEANSSRNTLLEKGYVKDLINNPCHLISDQASKLRCNQNQSSWKKLNRTDFSNPQISECGVLTILEEKEQCLLAMMWSLIIANKRHLNCNQLSFDQSIFEICKILEGKSDAFKNHEINQFSKIKQKDKAFTYIQQKKGYFVDINNIHQGSFTHPGGWTWNTKIVDLDADGFQDIINSEGAIRSHKTGWNTFMHNQGNTTFKQEQWNYKLTDPFSLFSFALIDYDFDGDLDIIGNSSAGPIQVYRNETKNNSIIFMLEDHQSNLFGVGSKIYLKTAKGLQLRELKASGGYQSFDPLSVHFGLGESISANELKIVWPDGKSHIMPGTWQAGYQYEIKRLPKNRN